MTTVATSAAGASSADARDLRISILLDRWTHFEGTAARLAEEGLIPNGFEWPEGMTDRRWSKDGLEFWLRRTRPADHKGPMRSWLTIDSWFVRVSKAGALQRHDADRRDIERKARALKEEIHRQSPEGRREEDAFIRKVFAAVSDPAFQAFKAKCIPERQKPKEPR